MGRARFVMAAWLLFSLSVFAQHSSGGGGGGGGSVGGGGGGGHSSGGGGSSGGSSAGHASSGSGGHASSSHASGSGASHSSAHGSSNSSLHPGVSRNANTQPEKRGFFFFLHRHHAPAPVVVVPDYRKRICPKGGCPSPNPYGYYSRTGYFCSRWGFWAGSACGLNGNLFDECAGLRAALAAQLQRVYTAQAAEESACAGSGSAECSSRMTAAQSEASLYHQFLVRYQHCQMGRAMMSPFGSFGVTGFRGWTGYIPAYDSLSEPWMYESWTFDVGYH